jgi:SH3-like domain-containing protein
MPVMRLPAVIVLAVLLAGCSSGPERAPAIGEVFVGPSSVALRQELHPRSAVTATVKHGDRLEVLQRRRRFFKVRTGQGVEGWTDARQLLAPREMARLQRIAQRSAQLPSQGRATVYDALNIHTEPNRQAPSFAQIPEKGSVEVLAHKLAPRVPYSSPVLNVGAPEPPAPRKKPKKKDDRIPPPPVPAPPAPPANWLELSKTPEDPKPALPQAEPKPAPGAPMEDWSLVRTPDGKAGWVLTRMLIMAIPDEVAQYAEGHRITSYFSLGEVRDGELTKQTWLWTTLSKTQQPFQFDGFRIFVWSIRRHRYETAYIERNVEGYFPGTVQPVEAAEGRQKARVPGFSLILREKDGSLAKRTYAFFSPRVKLIRKEPWTPPPDEDKDLPPAAKPAAEKAPPSGLRQRLDAWRKRWFQR